MAVDKKKIAVYLQIKAVNRKKAMVDVGNMMDQFLKVPFSGKIHKILEGQEKLAANLSVWSYNMC
jgi:hypothetical protein